MDVSAPHHRIAIVGSGFAGLGMAIRLKRDGIPGIESFQGDMFHSPAGITPILWTGSAWG